MLLKNSNKINALNKSEPIKKYFISFLTLSAICVRISGKPLKCVSILVDVSNASTAVLISAIIKVRLDEFKVSLLIRTPIK